MRKWKEASGHAAFWIACSRQKDPLVSP